MMFYELTVTINLDMPDVYSCSFAGKAIKTNSFAGYIFYHQYLDNWLSVNLQKLLWL